MKKLALSVLLSAILILCLSPLTVSAELANKPITPAKIKEVTFIHYAKPDMPPGQAKKNDPEPEPESAYELIGTILENEFTYRVNTSGAPDGALGSITASFDTWDSIVATDLFSYGGATDASGRNFDGQNTVSWKRIAPKSTIAMATFWYANDGDSTTMDPIVEFDIVFNSFLSWGIDTDGEGTADILTDAFDIQNIATHEVGHIVGLADLYSSDNSEQTMYGYGSIGETRKISLNDGDIAGTHAIYD